jgi:hypothetical protein
MKSFLMFLGRLAWRITPVVLLVLLVSSFALLAVLVSAGFEIEVSEWVSESFYKYVLIPLFLSGLYTFLLTVKDGVLFGSPDYNHKCRNCGSCMSWEKNLSTGYDNSYGHDRSMTEHICLKCGHWIIE